MSGTRKRLAHSRGECKYPVNFIPKDRRRAIDGELRKLRGESFPDRARQQGGRLSEGHWLPEHVHRGLELPPQ